MRKGKDQGDNGSLRAFKPQESSYIKFNFYTLCEQAQRQSPGHRPTSRAAKPRGSTDLAPASTGFLVEIMGLGGPALREAASPLHPAGAGTCPQRAAGSGRECASEPRSTPGARSLRRGRVPSPAPSGALSQCGQQAAPRRPRHGLRSRADSPRPPARAASLRVPAAAGPSPAGLHPGGTQQAAVRGRSPSSRSRRHRPKRTQAEGRRRKPRTLKPTQFPTSFSYPETLDEMRHDHRAAAAAAPGSVSAPARCCVNTGPAPTAPPPFAATAFFPKTNPHPPRRMRHLAAAAAGRTLRRHGLIRACAPGPIPGF